MRKILSVFAIAAAVMEAMPVLAADCCSHGGQCPMAKEQHGGAQEPESMCPITDKLMD